MAGIRIETLGRLRVTRGGEEVADLPTQPVRWALLVYLAMERDAGREILAALLWPDRDPERARHSLNQTLYELRRQLGDDWARTRGERVQVAPHVSVDALEFAAHAEAGRDAEASALYGGHFSEGTPPGRAPAYEIWVDQQRRRLGRLHRDVRRRLVAERVEAGRLEEALEAARRWVELDPLEDEAQHRLVELLARTGRRHEALGAYEGYAELLARELEVEPLDETKELVERIRAGTDGTRGAEKPLPGPGEDGPGEEPLPAHRHAGGGLPPFGPPWLSMASRSRAWLLLPVVLLATLLLFRGGDGEPGGAAAGSPLSPSPEGIAVLPFLNMSPDPGNTYIADGMTEDLITALSRIEGLRVISRTSVMRYRDTGLASPAIAAELRVRYLLEGSVRREDDRIRIAVQLIDAGRDDHLWAETWDRDLSGVFQLQSEITQRIAEELRYHLPPADRVRIAGGGTGNPQAWDLLLRGLEYLNRPGDADLRKFPPAVAFFRRSLEADPGYARAHAALAEAHRRNMGLLTTIRRDSALVHAGRAVELDPELAEAHAALGGAYILAQEPDRADAAYGGARDLDPNHAEALAGLARLSAFGGRPDEAIRWQGRAVSVDPGSALRHATLGQLLLEVGDLEGAEARFRWAVELAPDFPDVSYLLARIHLIRGDEDGADRTMEALLEVAADHPAALMLAGRYETQRGRYERAEGFFDRNPVRVGAASVWRAFLLERMGRGAEARAVMPGSLERFEERGEGPAPPFALLYHATFHGDHDRALAILREHWRAGLRSFADDPPEIGIYWIDQEPFLGGLRDDPVFHELLAEIRTELDAIRKGLVEAGP